MLTHYYTKRGQRAENLAFRSKGYCDGWSIPSGAGGLAMAELPAILRTLLVTDGTVTKSLESYFWEAVNVEAVRNLRAHGERAIAWLELDAGAPVLTRSVSLVGASSRRLYATAFSVLRVDVLPAELVDALLTGQVGIGALIRQASRESYRELLELGFTRDMSAFGGPPTDEECVYRCYRIVLSGSPAVLVSECFPLAVYGSGAGDGALGEAHEAGRSSGLHLVPER